MNDENKIGTLLASAGMLMEDASARMILGEGSVEQRVAELRHVADDLAVIADAVDVIRRRLRLER